MEAKCELCGSESKVNYMLTYDFTFVSEETLMKAIRVKQRVRSICEKCAYSYTIFKFRNAKVVNLDNHKSLYLASNGTVYEHLTGNTLLFEFKNSLEKEFPTTPTNAWVVPINGNSYTLVAVVGEHCFTSKTCDTQEECFDALTPNYIASKLQPNCKDYYKVIRGFERVLRAYYPSAIISTPPDTIEVSIPDRYLTSWTSKSDDWRMQELASMITWIIKDMQDFESTCFEVSQ